MLKKFFSSFVSSKNETTENYLPEKKASIQIHCRRCIRRTTNTYPQKAL